MLSLSAIAHSQQSSTEDAWKHMRRSLLNRPLTLSLMLKLGASPASNWQRAKFRPPSGGHILGAGQPVQEAGACKDAVAVAPLA